MEKWQSQNTRMQYSRLTMTYFEKEKAAQGSVSTPSLEPSSICRKNLQHNKPGDLYLDRYICRALGIYRKKMK